MKLRLKRSDDGFRVTTSPFQSRPTRVIGSAPSRSSSSSDMVLTQERCNTLEDVRNRLHTSEVSRRMPCREEEYKKIKQFILTAKAESHAMYISGVPGTGKTSATKNVVEEIREKNIFTYVYVNAMELLTANQIFVIIYKLISGESINISHPIARRKLNSMFNVIDKKRLPVLIVIDELDSLCTKRQEILYDIFDWGMNVKARVSVIGIANTLDLPERMLTPSIISRLGVNRVIFQPYTFSEIEMIIGDRLRSPNNLVFPEAIQLAARKVASISGDLRKALDVLRKAVEIAIDHNSEHVDTSHVAEAYKEATSVVRVLMVVALPLHSLLLFRAAVAQVEKSGLEEFAFIDMYKQYCLLCTCLEGSAPIQEYTCYSMVMRMCSNRLLVAGPGTNCMKRKVRLGMQLTEAQFAIKAALDRMKEIPPFRYEDYDDCQPMFKHDLDLSITHPLNLRSEDWNEGSDTEHDLDLSHANPTNIGSVELLDATEVVNRDGEGLDRDEGKKPQLESSVTHPSNLRFEDLFDDSDAEVDHLLEGSLLDPDEDIIEDHIFTEAVNPGEETPHIDPVLEQLEMYITHPFDPENDNINTNEMTQSSDEDVPTKHEEEPSDEDVKQCWNNCCHPKFEDYSFLASSLDISCTEDDRELVYAFSQLTIENRKPAETSHPKELPFSEYRESQSNVSHLLDDSLFEPDEETDVKDDKPQYHINKKAVLTFLSGCPSEFSFLSASLDESCTENDGQLVYAFSQLTIGDSSLLRNAPHISEYSEEETNTVSSHIWQPWKEYFEDVCSSHIQSSMIQFGYDHEEVIGDDSFKEAMYQLEVENMEHPDIAHISQCGSILSPFYESESSEKGTYSRTSHSIIRPWADYLETMYPPDQQLSDQECKNEDREDGYTNNSEGVSYVEEVKERDPVLQLLTNINSVFSE